jgi:Putative esterase
MKLFAFFLLAVLCCAPELFGQTNSNSAPPQRRPGVYHLGPDSLPQAGVPKGKLEGPFLFHSRIFTNTVREYWIFVPAQYTPEKPACVLVFQDGQRAVKTNGSLRVPQVMENLIAKKEMPVTIGIFITPGARGGEYKEVEGGNPDNRSTEYDSLNDNYTRFLIEEMLPEVGKKYNLTTDPEGRAIGGTSSGAICAFTVAWQRPDVFRKVISCIGSFTSIAYRPATNGLPMIPGGELYPTLIRKNPIKPLTIFLQDGSKDLNNEHGNWFLANQQMLSALEWANANADRHNAPGPRYRINHDWGDGGHTDTQGGAILPDILRWLWRDYPK